jgi:hypothetical protein
MSAYADRLLGPLRSLIRGATARVDYYALYSAVVNVDKGDETCDLTPEDSRLPSMQSIPKLYGVPGLTSTLKPGAKVLLCFQNGDPGRPAIVLFGSSVPAKVSAQGDAVNLAGDPGAAAVGRVGDDTGTGILSMLAVNTGTQTNITLQWVPQGGGAPVVIGTIALLTAGGTALGAGAGPCLPATLAGKITSGSSKAKSS